MFRERCSELHEKDFRDDEKEKLLRLTQVEMRLVAVEENTMELTERVSYIERKQEDPIPENIRGNDQKKTELNFVS